MAFTEEEREELGLSGLLPPAILSLDRQAGRAYSQYLKQPDDLAKYLFMTALRDRNEVLFYRLLSERISEMLPIVYDPTIGEAIERYSHEYRRPRGVYLSIDEPDRIKEAFENLGLGSEEVDLIVATDAKEILGIGDWGVGGMDLVVGKLAVYTAAAGISPARVIPVMLDVGTDNRSLLNDPVYIGNRHSRVRGERYDDFIEAYVSTVTELYPDALLHWEDFGPGNARRLLEKYGDRTRTFNDDMQGTGAIVLAATLAAVRSSGSPMSEQRVVIFGAGTAGVGIADQLREAMVRDGLDRDEATRRFWCVDRQGLLVDDMEDLRDYQQPYARPRDEIRDWSGDDKARLPLSEVVSRVQPTMLVGTSTVGGAFTEESVREMARNVERPIIFPLSNPTERHEATPENLLRWTDGQALVATGAPFAPVKIDDTTYEIGQANNALLYPGLGLGTVVTRAQRISDGMFEAAAEAVAGMVDAEGAGAPLLPPVEDLRATSAIVAGAVAERAAKEGLSRVELTDTIQQVQDALCGSRGTAG